MNNKGQRTSRRPIYHESSPNFSNHEFSCNLAVASNTLIHVFYLMSQFIFTLFMFLCPRSLQPLATSYRVYLQSGRGFQPTRNFYKPAPHLPFANTIVAPYGLRILRKGRQPISTEYELHDTQGYNLWCWWMFTAFSLCTAFVATLFKHGRKIRSVGHEISWETTFPTRE